MWHQGPFFLEEKVLCFVHSSPSLHTENGALQILLYGTLTITNNNNIQTTVTVVHKHLLCTSPLMQFTCINYVNYYAIL